MALTFRWDKIICFGSKAHPIKFKRKKGTFTLHNQAVLIETIVKIIEVHGIRINNNGRREGYIRFGGRTIRVVQQGKNGWSKK